MKDPPSPPAVDGGADPAPDSASMDVTAPVDRNAPDLALPGDPLPPVTAEASTLGDAGADNRPAAERPPAAADTGAGGGGPLGKTVCLNADGPGGRDTYALLESILGSNCIENPDSDHSPPFRHVQEDMDSEVGPHFVVYSHPDDSDMGRDNGRNRCEFKIHNGAADALKGQPGRSFTYAWRFKMDGNVTVTNGFFAMFQMKSTGGGNDGKPIITLSARRNGGAETFFVEYTGDSDYRILSRVPMTGLRGLWLEVLMRFEVSQSGAFFVSIKKPDGSEVLRVDEEGLDLWRQGGFTRGKWGIYRGKNGDHNPVETVRFANFGFTPGGTPDSDCRGGR